MIAIWETFGFLALFKKFPIYNIPGKGLQGQGYIFWDWEKKIKIVGTVQILTSFPNAMENGSEVQVACE